MVRSLVGNWIVRQCRLSRERLSCSRLRRRPGTRMPRRRPSSRSFSRTSLQRGLAEVADFEQLVFAAADQVADRVDVFRFQAVGGPDRQLQARPGSCSSFDSMAASTAHAACREPARGRCGPSSVYCTNGLRCLRRILAASTSAISGRDRAVGPDLQRQLVVVGLLTDAGFFDLVADADDRAVDRVDRDDADFLDVRAVLGRRARSRGRFRRPFPSRTARRRSAWRGRGSG